MKRSNLSKVVGAGILTLNLAILPLSLPASAQSNAESNTPTVDTTPLQETEDDNNNWGWLGLIGLVGLVNLFRKSKPPVRHEPDVAGRSDSRY